MTKNELWESIESNKLMTMDGYDDCIVGIGYRYENEPYVVYDTNKIINKLMNKRYRPGNILTPFRYIIEERLNV